MAETERRSEYHMNLVDELLKEMEKHRKNYNKAMKDMETIVASMMSAEKSPKLGKVPVKKR